MEAPISESLSTDGVDGSGSWTLPSTPATTGETSALQVARLQEMVRNLQQQVQDLQKEDTPTAVPLELRDY